jgi:DNA repair exonuclease SbcCD ATPase subunit
MIIKKLTITNFGQHEFLDLEFNGSVIGIIGPNGHGKSTVSHALIYAFLGELPDVYSDVIRHGAKELKVNCVFVKNNIEYTIERSVTNKGKSTRKLMYEGLEKPLTAAKDVDATIESILGADKQTVLNCIFISQGDIDSIINDSPTKRIELLVKLLNLNFLNKRFSSINDAIKKLENTVTPIAPLKELLETTIQDYNSLQTKLDEKKTELEENFGSKEFIHLVINSVSDYKHQLETINSLTDSVETGMEYLVQLKTEIYNDIKESNLDLISLEFDNRLEAEKELLSKLEAEYINRLQFHKKYKDSEEIFNTYINNLKLIKKFLNLKKDKFFDLDNEQLINLKTKLESIKTFQVNYNTNLENKVRLENEINTLTQSNTKSIEEIATLENKVRELETTLSFHKDINISLNKLFETKIQIKNEFLKNPTKKHSCPLCGLKLEAGQDISDEDLKNLTDQISFNSIKTQELENNLISTKYCLNRLLEEKSQAEAHIKFNNQRLKELNDLIENINIDEYINIELQEYKELLSSKTFEDLYILFNSEDFNELERLIICNKTTLQTKDNLEFMFKDLTGLNIENYNSFEDIKDNLPEEILENINEPSRLTIEDQKNTIFTKQNLINKFKLNVEQLNKQKSVLDSIYEKIKSHEALSITETIANMQSNENKCKKLHLSNIDETVNICINQGLESIKFIESLEVEVNLKLKDKTQKELQIQDLENKNKIIYEKLANLTAIQSLLNPKEGITKQYLRYIFSVIQGYVSEYLASMDANFIIDIDDPDYSSNTDTSNTKHNLLSFKFLRTDIEGSQWLGMHRLSGGQKIKLAIAMLIAIQKLICPEICFLMLDEPSTHLDTNSVNTLSTMLGNLKEMLNNSEGQIFVIDHNEILNRSFTTTINL